MGVRQLQTFIQTAVPNGYIKVSLDDECEAFKRKNNAKPIILVDIMGILRPINKCNKEVLCGIRHNEAYKRIERLFSKLASIAELIFFEDGPVSNVKLPQWIKRQNEQYRNTLNIIDKINEGYTLDDIINSEKDIPSQTTHLGIAGKLAKKYGTLIFTFDRECDAEMAQYACRDPRVLAVLAEDSDFLIYPGMWRYFSIKQLEFDDQNNLTTMEFNRVALIQHLDFNEEDMVLLSTLNGNDVIDYNDTYRFRRYLIRNANPNNPMIRFPTLANYIKSSGILNKRDMYEEVAYNIYGRVNGQTVEKVKESFEFYDINFQHATIQDKLMQYCHKNTLIFTFSILKYSPKTFTTHYIDLRCCDFTDKSMKLFCKQIGILLKSKPHRKYEVCIKMTHNDVFRTMYVDPTIPEQNLPPLNELLDKSSYPQHNPLRFDLLKWMINYEKLRTINLESIPAAILLDIIVLVYMVCEEFITPAEADIILLSLKHVETDTVPENLEIPSNLHPRAFLISFLFSKLTMNIKRSLEVTGLNDLKKVHKFDGVLFHYLYLKHAAQTFNINMLLGDLMDYRHYA